MNPYSILAQGGVHTPPPPDWRSRYNQDPVDELAARGTFRAVNAVERAIRRLRKRGSVL